MPLGCTGSSTPGVDSNRRSSSRRRRSRRSWRRWRMAPASAFRYGSDMSDRAALLVRTGDGREKTYPLLKRLISVGRSPDNDVILDEEGVPDTALHLQREGEAIEVVSLDGPFLHNGKKKTRARLGPEDELRVGSATLRLGKPSAPRKAEDRGPLVALERLHEFSKKVLGNHPTEEVLAHLMDTAIELTGADKGFLVLLEGDAFRVE